MERVVRSKDNSFNIPGAVQNWATLTLTGGRVTMTTESSRTYKYVCITTH